jgi:hypothetical protein
VSAPRTPLRSGGPLLTSRPSGVWVPRLLCPHEAARRQDHHLILLAVVNGEATKVLRADGYKVGLFGAKKT